MAKLRPRLRTQFFVVILVLVAGAASALTYSFIKLHRASLTAATADKVKMMTQSLADEAATLAKAGAVTSARSAVMEDFSFLQKVLAATVAGDKNIVHALIANAEGKIVVHSTEKLVGTSAAALAESLKDSKDVATQEVRLSDGTKGIEAIAPIFVGSDRWGTVRYTLSLATAEQQIAATQRRLAAITRQSIRSTLIATIIILLLAVVVAALAARRIVRPMAVLEDAVQQVLAGKQGVKVTLTSPPDVVRLADGFNAMLESIAQRANAMRQDRRRAETALEEAKEASTTKQHFLARVSHGLLQPLDRIEQAVRTVTKGFEPATVFVCTKCSEEFEPDPGSKIEPQKCPSCAGALRKAVVVRHVAPPEETSRGLAELETRGTELRELVGSILDFSVLQAQQRKLEVQAMDVVKLVESAKAALASTAEAKRLIWPTRVPPARIEGDPKRIEQAVALSVELLAILNRQADAMIRLEVDECSFHGASGIQFVARDNGAGLAREYVDALKNGTAPDVRATLCMMALRRVASLHDGELSLESEAGRGTTLRLILPQRHRQSAAQSAGATTAA